MQNNGYLLLVEDEPIVQAKNKSLLERRGYCLRQAYTLTEAGAMIAKEPPLAIVLDVGLPDGNGIDFLRNLRKTSTIPVLMLSAMGTSQDVILGLETGCDDYLSKPYELPIFIARIEALLRRALANSFRNIKLGRLKLDVALGAAFIDDEDIMLSKKEYSLLKQFAQAPEKALGAAFLYEKVWGQNIAGDNSALKNAIYKLRKKLEKAGYTITFERGEGYMLERT